MYDEQKKTEKQHTENKFEYRLVSQKIEENKTKMTNK